jgi:hypothetical protein
MKRSLSILLFTATTVLAAAPAYPALHELDLANGTGEQTIQVQPGEALSFKVIHRVPQFRYSVQVQIESIPIPALPPPGGATPGGAENPCTPLIDVTKNLLNAKDEAEVASLVSRARELLAAQPGCPQPTTVRGVRSALQQTEISLAEVFTPERNELVRITISRPDGEGSKTWVFVFTTGARGSWGTSYGFVFLGDRDRTFFSKPTADGKSFTIAEKRSSGGGFSNLNFAPSFFYTWLPRRDENRDWSPGLTFGLGFDQSHPVLFAGGSLNYNRFVSLIAGAAIHQQKRLNGQYRMGQPLDMELSDDALHEEKFGVNYFFGLSFRFNANPFSSDSGDPKPAKPAEPAKPAPTPGGNS